MNGFIEHLPGLLDDPYIQSTDLPALTDLHIAPLRNPAPSRNTNIPSPLEPLADNASPAVTKPRNAHAQSPQEEVRKRTPRITPGDVILARDAKKPNLTIRELVEASTFTQFEPTYLPSFVSLAVVERSPIQRSLALDSATAQKLLRLDASIDNVSTEGYRRLPPLEQSDGKPAARPLPLLPAMVTGLHQPPQSAALLPSMDTDSLPANSVGTAVAKKMRVTTVIEVQETRCHGLPPELMLNSPESVNAVLPERDSFPVTELRDEGESLLELTSGIRKGTMKSSRRAPNKWTVLETEQLMTGVQQYGVGKWKQILNDPEFNFDNRSTVDLKDRYRVCQPGEYKNRRIWKTRGADLALNQSSPSSLNNRPNSSAIFEASPGKVVAKNPSDGSGDYPRPASPNTIVPDSASNAPSPLSPPSNKRRKRRPWTTDEDERLVKGITKYGFQWSMIHSDVDLGFSHRTPMDLRDRVRNKFPQGYKAAETAPLKAEWRIPSAKRSVSNHSTDIMADVAPGKRPTKRPKKAGKDRVNSVQSGMESLQEHPGVKLPPLIDESDLDWENNTLAPLLDWDDIGI